MFLLVLQLVPLYWLLECSAIERDVIDRSAGDIYVACGLGCHRPQPECRATSSGVSVVD